MEAQAERSPAAHPPDDPPTASSTRVAVLIFTDIVGSTALKSELGDVAYKGLLDRHNFLFELTLREVAAAGNGGGSGGGGDGPRAIKHTGDGYLAEFARPSDAVHFAVLFQYRMAVEPWTPQVLRTRVGLHQGRSSRPCRSGAWTSSSMSAGRRANVCSGMGVPLPAGNSTLRLPCRNSVQTSPGLPVQPGGGGGR